MKIKCLLPHFILLLVKNNLAIDDYNSGAHHENLFNISADQNIEEVFYYNALTESMNESMGKPSPRNVEWGEWSAWSSCSKTCGLGISQSKRHCYIPQGYSGGKYCLGPQIKHKVCSVESCENENVSFRDLQCAAFNDWLYPQDGLKHNWTANYNHNENPCSLVCKNEQNEAITLSSTVIDGTSCYRGVRDVCIQGLCQTIPCDLTLGSNALEDACGVCHGDGTTCEHIQGRKSFNETDLSLLVEIPKGSKNIIVKEDQPTKSRIVMKSRYTNDIYNKGIKLGKFKIPGSTAWIGMQNYDQEMLFVPGPNEEPFDILVRVLEPVSMSYSYGIPVPPRNGQYSWDYSGWGKCSANCGPGIQQANVKCIESKTGIVEDKYCKTSEELPFKARPCNLGPCAPRWFAFEWEKCNPCPSKDARRLRNVICVYPTRPEHHEFLEVNERFCTGKKPKTFEKCLCPTKKSDDFTASNKFKGIGQTTKYSELTNHSLAQIKKTPKESKITLMDIENENASSMRKQLNSNAHKSKAFLIFNGHHIYITKPTQIPLERIQKRKGTFCYFNKFFQNRTTRYNKHKNADGLIVNVKSEIVINILFPRVLKQIGALSESSSNLNYTAKSHLFLLALNLRNRLLTAVLECQTNYGIGSSVSTSTVYWEMDEIILK